MQIAYSWAIPDKLSDGSQLQNGDYFTFKLPDNTHWLQGDLTGNLEDPNTHVVYGTYSVDLSTGLVTYTFNQTAADSDNVHGTWNYSSTVSSQTTTGPQDITVQTSDGPKTGSIVVKSTTGSPIDKKGTLTGENSSNNNPTGITWTVNVNTNGQELNNASVADTMPTGTYDGGQVPSSIADPAKDIVITASKVQADGTLVADPDASSPLVYGTDYDVNSDGTIVFKGSYADTRDAFKIVYNSQIDATKIPDNGGTVNFANKALLTNNGNTTSATASVNASYGKLLDKTFGQEQDGQIYSWNIDYNFGEKQLTASQATIIDTLSAGQEYVPRSIQVTDEDNQPITSGYTIVPSKNSDGQTVLTIQFTDGLTHGVKISYDSHYVAGINGNTTSISNSADSDGQSTGDVSQTVSQQGLTKSLGDVDYDAKTVAWNLDINRAAQDMTDWSVHDDVPAGLTVDYSSFTMKDLTNPGTSLQEGTDFTVTADPSGAGFTVAFIGDLQQHAKDRYELSYVTAFDTNKLPADSNNTWTNNATDTWTDQSGDKHSNTGTASFTPKMEFVNDGSKGGSYDAVKKQINWTVVVNYNQRELSGATITDTVQDPQSYIDGSAKLYTVNINKDGSYDPSSEQATSIKVAYNTANQQLSAILPDGGKQAYVLEYSTSLAGQVIDQSSYPNTARYVNNTKPSDLTASVSIPDGGNLVDKTGVQGTGSDADYVHYTLWANREQSTVHDLTVTDTPDPSMIIDGNSVVINPTTIDANGFHEDAAHPLQLGTDYTVDLETDNATGKQTLTIKFLHEVTTAYVIHYRALINTPLTSTTVTNEAGATATGTKTTTGQSQSKVDIYNANGSATGTNLNLIIKKTDLVSKDALVNASFDLYALTNGQKGQLLRQGTTDSNGKITWGNLRAGNYVLVETAAPSPYIIPSDLATGRTITLSYSDADSNEDVTQNITNQKGTVTLKKTDADTGAALSGAIFSLYSANGNLIQAGLATDQNGQLSYSGLDAGSYYFVETAAPAGYNLDSSHHNFTLDSSHITTNVNVSDSETSGSVILYKTDSDTNQALQGAVFRLYQANGTQIGGDRTTDAAGTIQVGDLKPGNYYFKEIAAPAGYTLGDTTQYDFSIVLGQQSTAVVVNAGNAEERGSLVMNKTDSDTNQPLSGAVFSIYRVGNAQPVLSNQTTDANGQFTASGLLPGKYYYVETKAPDGYVLDGSHHNFTIAFDQVTPLGVSAQNTKKTGSVRLAKIDADTNKPLAGAYFNLYEADGNEIQSNLKTGDDGYITVDNLKPGDYYFKETDAPAGYSFDADKTYAFTIDLNPSATDIKTVAVTNAEKRGSVILTKKSSNGQNLAGAVFEIRKASDDSVVASNLTTDSDGQIRQDDLLPGDYYFVETKAPDGYVLNTVHTPFIIAFNPTSTPATASETNYKGSATLTKTDAQGNPLSGAIFKVVDKNGKDVQTNLTSDAKGLVTVTDLAPGDYSFVETQAPDGYVLNTNKTDFTIAASAQNAPAVVNASSEFMNYQGTATLTKTDAKGNPLSGAIFKVVDKNGKDVQTGLTSNAQGIVTTTKLAPGQYEFVETQAPDGYVLNTTGTPFTIHTQAAGQPEVVNASSKFINYKGSAQLTKTDATGQPLQGAVFKVVDKNGKDVQTGLTSGKDGKVTVTDLAPGQYLFYETQAPTGYVLNTAGTPFTIHTSAKGEPAIVTVAANFVNYQGKAQLIKTDKDGKPLAGATFEVRNKAGQVVASNLTSDNQGVVSVDKLAPGQYEFVETKAPAGYILNTTGTSFTIHTQAKGEPTIVTASDQFINYKGSAQLTKTDNQGNPLVGATFKVVDKQGKDVQTGLISDKDGHVTVDNLAPGQYAFYETKAPAGYVLNTTGVPFMIHTAAKGQPAVVKVTENFVNYQGSATLTKKDEAGNPLSGAIFKVVDKNGKDVQTGLTTGSDGKVTVANLAPGQYEFVETQAPIGYILNQTSVAFTIQTAAKGQPVQVDASDNFINYQGSATLTKTDADGHPLAGAEFKVLDSKGNTVISKLVSDETGKVTATHLAPGDYSFVETKAPAGYVLNTTPTSFTIAASAKGEPQVVVASEGFINYKGSATLTKKDEAGNPLAGATFKVVDKNGKDVQTSLISDAKGHVTVTDLAPGDYSFVETKAPKGYILNTTKAEFTIAASAKGAPVTVKMPQDFVNYQGSAVLTKTDAQGNPLAGAEFKLVDQTGRTIKSGLVSDKNGLVKVDHLAPGKYQFIETKAPAGYKLNDKAVSFVIADQAAGKPETVNAGKLVNEKKPSAAFSNGHKELPNTGEQVIWFSTISGTLAAISVAEAWLLKRKRHED
ncbi:MAG: SpaA isopeptide-forming pilin-related protein [Oenococcus sp.]|uniref:SpaA isopeptide-forming pilin-related protein n=1 Tax=Oenococcus sp. TaxID=1979414 RepID=UPI0039E92B26